MLKRFKNEAIFFIWWYKVIFNKVQQTPIYYIQATFFIPLTYVIVNILGVSLIISELVIRIFFLLITVINSFISAFAIWSFKLMKSFPQIIIHQHPYNFYMNTSKQYKYKNLRWCERHKSTPVYDHVQAFAKKIRKKKDFSTEIINANAQQREIDVFYKVGWDYEHVHSSLTCDISDPLYIQQNPDLISRQDLTNYYDACRNFMQRLKIEHEDETAFKVDAQFSCALPLIKDEEWQNQCLRVEEKKNLQNLICAKQCYYNFIQSINVVVMRMLKNLQQYEQIDTESAPYLKVRQTYETISQWLQFLKGDESYQNLSIYDWTEQQINNEIKVVHNMHEFMVNQMKCLQKMRKDKIGCLFNYQPQISVLTYLIHPLLLGIYSTHFKQGIVWENEYEHNLLNIKFNRKLGKQKLLQDVKHFQLPKTVFISFDGYQSQFNIQFSKNMKNHLMYISFPKLLKDSSDENLSLNNRMFKKICFNYCRQLYEYESSDFDIVNFKGEDGSSKYGQFDNEGIDQEDELNRIRRQLQIKFDPQKYFSQIKNLYQNSSNSQSNSNIYILPIAFQYLTSQLRTMFQEKDINAALHASSFVSLLFQDFLFDEIRKFNPHQIVISYSGLVQLQDDHFIKIIQELSEISNRKILFFNNLTTKLVQSQVDDHYDNFIEVQQNLAESCRTDLFRKMSQFLKIISGTYNLQYPRQNLAIIPKFKLAKINSYARGLIKALSEVEYPHLKNKVSDLILRIESMIVSRSIQDSIKDIRSSIPPFYQNLIQHLRYILSGETNKYPPHLQKTVKMLKAQISGIPGKLGHLEAYLEDIRKKMQLQIVSEKYSETVFIYLKSKIDKIQYEQLKESVQQSKGQQQSMPNIRIAEGHSENNNLQDCYILSLRYNNKRNEKLTLQSYPSSEILYRQNQTHKFIGNGKRTANIMFMNNLEDNEFISYAGMVLMNQPSSSDEKKVNSQRVQMYPITINGQPQLTFGHFTKRAQWNYAQTQRYYIIYWPVAFNFLEAQILQLGQQVYEPQILNQIYVAEIPSGKDYRLVFNRVNAADTDMITKPRRNCTSLSLMDQDKIFILGGFYDRMSNYLDLQTQITGIDLQLYTNQNRKCSISNEKGVLYSNLDMKREENKRSNSYVRARKQFQIFSMEQLCDHEDPNQMDNLREFILIGGFGQNFVRPFSLMSCNYYKIQIKMDEKKIESIERKFVYQKIITSNIRGFIKNDGYFKSLALLDKNSLKPNQRIGENDYIGHRSVYKITKQKKQQHGYEEQLHIKTKYLFAINLYSNVKKPYLKVATKIGQYFDSKTNDTSQFFLQFSAQGNNYLCVRKNKSEEQTVQIFLQKMQSKTLFHKVPLTHGSIVSIDIRFKNIYAIVKHDLYTFGKFVLTHCEMPNHQSEIVLRIVSHFNQNLSQHSLFIPRPGQVLLLHGLTFSGVQINDFSVRITKKEISKEDQIKKLQENSSIDPRKYKKCFSLLIKDENRESKIIEIQSLNILIPSLLKSPFFILRRSRLRLSNQNLEFGWRQNMEIQITIIEQDSKSKLALLGVQQARLIRPHLDNNLSLLQFSSPMLFSLVKSSQDLHILCKFECQKRHNYYIAAISQKSIQEKMKISQEVSLTVVSFDVQQSRRIWQMGTPIKCEMKSLNKYEDMGLI